MAQVEQGLVLTAPERQVLLKRLKDADRGNTERAPDDRLLEWIGPEVEGSEQFAEPGIGGDACGYPGCALWAVDLDQDGQNEVLQLPKQTWSDPLYFFKRDAQGNWLKAGTYEGTADPLALIEQIREGKVKVVKPRYQSLQIDGVELSPTPDNALEP